MENQKMNTFPAGQGKPQNTLRSLSDGLAFGPTAPQTGGTMCNATLSTLLLMFRTLNLATGYGIAGYNHFGAAGLYLVVAPTPGKLKVGHAPGSKHLLKLRDFMSCEQLNML